MADDRRPQRPAAANAFRMNPSPPISLVLRDGAVMVGPSIYLGRDIFNRYRKVCDAHGAIFSPDFKAQKTSVDLVPPLIEALSAAGFLPQIDAGLASALSTRAASARADLTAAAGRLVAVKATLTSLGKSLFKFQEFGVTWLAARESALLCDEMGLGKTIQALVAAPANAPLVVVAPAKLKGVWAKECSRWRPDLSIAMLKGRSSFRWPVPGELVITNYDILPPTTHELPLKQATDALLAPPPLLEPAVGTVIIADECHRLKSPKASRTQRFRAMAKVVKSRGGRAWGLTGTPMMNRPEELFSLLTTFALVAESFGNYPRFLTVMAAKKKYWGGFSWGTPTAAAIDALRSVMLRRLQCDVLPDLPTMTWDNIDISIDRQTMDLAAEVRTLLEADGIDLAAVLAETQNMGKHFEEIAKLRRLMATAKIPAILDIIAEFEEEEEPLVVFCCHRAPLEVIGRRPGWRTIMGGTPNPSEIEDLFQAGSLKGVAIQITCAEGFTLTRAHNVRFVDLFWTSTANQQAAQRILRIGQENKCHVGVLSVPGTIDEDVANIVMTKATLIAASVDQAAMLEADEKIQLDPERFTQAAQVERCPTSTPQRTPPRTPKNKSEIWAGSGLLQLASLQDGVGFIPTDQTSGQSIAGQLAKYGKLTDAQWRAAVRLCARYCEHLGRPPGGG